MRVLNQQWEDSLRGERYPFEGTGQITTTTGRILDDDAILDLNLMVSQDTSEVFLSSITVTDTAVLRFTLSDGTLAGTLTVTSTVTESEPVLRGDLVVGYARLNPDVAKMILTWQQREHSIVDVQIIPHLLIVSDVRWQPGLELPDGTILTGDIYLVADIDLWLERTATGARLHCSGDPFDGRTEPQRGLLTLSGREPDQNGNINLIGLSTTNLVGALFVGAGSPFRINLTPGEASLTIELTGANQ